MTISVSADDPRTDDEIRDKFLSRFREEMESLKIKQKGKTSRVIKETVSLPRSQGRGNNY